VKRVVATPGERVVVKNCKVSVFNRQHPKAITPTWVIRLTGCAPKAISTRSSPRQCVCTCNNRNPGGSSDSREWGVLSNEYIIGNVVLRLFPFDGIRIF